LTQATKKCDPVLFFPLEITITIFSFLTLSSLLRLQFVSHSWRAVLSSASSLYRSLNLLYSEPLNIHNCKALIRYAAGNIRELKMHLPRRTFAGSAQYCIALEDSPLAPLFSHLERFTEKISTRYPVRAETLLNLPGFPSPFLRHVCIQDRLEVSSIQYLCNLTPQLEYLGCTFTISKRPTRLGNFPSVKILRFRVIKMMDWKLLECFLSQFPNIDDFGLHGGNTVLPSFQTLELPWKRLKVADIRAVICVTALRLPHCDHLRVLKIKDMENLRTIETATLMHLEKLYLSNVERLEPMALKAFYHSTRSLYRLEINQVEMPAEDFEAFLSKCVNLKMLNIGAFLYGDISDKTLAALYHLKSLKRLGIHYCNITDDGMVKLVEQLCVENSGNLATIYASENHKITKEIVDQARNLGVTVKLDRPTGKRGSSVTLPALK
jgi:hypothetical protein